MPDPRYAHCPACAGGRPDCPRCDGEGIVEEDVEFAEWKSDHTALVHVLWACDHDRLTLKDDFDAIGSRILQSEWYQATLQHAKARP